MKKKYIPKDLSTADLHQFLLGSVAPRPIAFVSTIDQDGLHNLAPYSFLMLSVATLQSWCFPPIEELKITPQKILLRISYLRNNAWSTL
ncbi:MAG: hypothetical protein IPK61_07400 [Saprospiraceae bacterium]|nr:hypothetical protein [Saprospiraceae bacterium]